MRKKGAAEQYWAAALSARVAVWRRPKRGFPPLHVEEGICGDLQSRRFPPLSLQPLSGYSSPSPLSCVQGQSWHPSNVNRPPREIKKVVEVAAGRKRKFQCQNLLLEPPSVFLLGLPSRPPPTYTTLLLFPGPVFVQEGRGRMSINLAIFPRTPPPLPATYCAPYLPRLRLRRKWRMRRGEVTGEMNGGGRQRSSSFIICTPPPSCCETRRIFMEDVSAGK